MSYFAQFLEQVLDALEALNQSNQLTQGELDEAQFQHKRNQSPADCAAKIVSMREMVSGGGL